MTFEKKKDYFVFLVGLAGIFKFRMLGTFYGNEILIYLSYLFINWKIVQNSKKVMAVIGMAFLWLIGTLISDAFNDTSLQNSLKGSCNVIFLIMLVPFVYWMMYDKLSRWLYYAAGAAIAWAVSFFTGRGMEVALGSTDNLLVWQVYFFFPSALIIASILYYRGNRWLAYLFIEGFGVWSLTCASRNIFLSMTIAVFILIFINSINGDNNNERIVKFKKRFIFLFVAFLLGVIVVSNIYERAASSGALGERVYTKYVMQKEAKGGIASGRSDFADALYFIYQSPVIGYGSYCTYENYKAYETAKSIGYTINGIDETLPSHSHILGAWVFSGVLGLLYWCYILLIMFRSIKSGNLLIDNRMLGIRIFTIMASLWNIMFSPFQNRIDILLLVINLLIFEEIQERNKSLYYDKDFNNSSII